MLGKEGVEEHYRQKLEVKEKRCPFKTDPFIFPTVFILLTRLWSYT